MKRLCFLFISLFVIGCSDFNPIEPEDCHCGMEISSDLPQNNGIYELEFNQNSAQTYSTLNCETECGWSQHILWDSDYQYKINGTWTSLVNPASMTDDNGDAKVVFAVWEEFINKTITIYGGYTDNCGHHFVDSIKVKIINNE